MTPEEIAAAIRQEADLAARPGQMARLNRWADAVLALTEQQPEPTAHAPHDGDFYDQFCREVEAQRIAGDLPAAAVVGICTRMAHRAQRKVAEKQPEPVSEDTLTTFLYDTALANLLNIDGDTPCVFAVELGRNFAITARPVASPTEET